MQMPVNVDDFHIDLASLSSHKIYGPKGIGALYVRRRPRVRLEPIFSGGGQERGLRSGTLAPSLCVGMGAAARLCAEDMDVDRAWIEKLGAKLKVRRRTTVVPPACEMTFLDAPASPFPLCLCMLWCSAGSSSGCST